MQNLHHLPCGVLRCARLAKQAAHVGVAFQLRVVCLSAGQNAAQDGREYAQVNIIIGLLLNMVLLYIVLKATDRVEKVISKAAIYLLRKFFGIILLAISVRLFTANLSNLLENLSR